MPETQSGWPVLPPDSKLLHTWTVPTPDGPTRLRLRNGSAGFLLCHLALWFDHRIEDLEEPVLDDWGYAYRPIRGYSTWSNHAGGVAIDLNATDHPLGVRGTFTDAEEAAIHRRLNFYDVVGPGGVRHDLIRGGLDYEGRPDEMHWEIVAPLAWCEMRARQLLDSPRGVRILKANPGQKAVILS